jgi:hypothetical protein
MPGAFDRPEECRTTTAADSEAARSVPAIDETAAPIGSETPLPQEIHCCCQRAEIELAAVDRLAIDDTLERRSSRSFDRNPSL